MAEPVAAAEHEAGAGPGRRPWQRRCMEWGALFTAAALLPILCWIFAETLWLIELGSHFVVHAGFLAGMGFLFFSAAWSRLGMSVAAAVAAIPALITGSYWFVDADGPHHRPESAGFTAVTANVLSDNTKYAEFKELLNTLDADAVAVLEVSPAWADELQQLAPAYPHRRIIPQRDNFGIALLSRWPLRDAEAFLSQRYPPVIDVYADTPDGPVRLIAAHTVPPTRVRYAGWRNGQIQDLARTIASETGACVLLGDLNVTMWSPVYRDLLKRGALRDTRRGRGIVGTWPATWRVFALPIDHCLYRGPIEACGLSVHGIAGSDHRALAASFVWTDSAE